MYTMKKTIFIAVIVALIAGGACLFYCLYNQSHVKKEMLVVAATVNKSAPIEINDFVLIDSAAVLSSRLFLYYCTMWQVEKEDISVGTIERYLFPEIIKEAKGDLMAAYLKKNKITLCYRFSDKNGKHIHDFYISPADLDEK